MANAKLNGKRVAILATDGVEQATDRDRHDLDEALTTPGRLREVKPARGGLQDVRSDSSGEESSLPKRPPFNPSFPFCQ